MSLRDNNFYGVIHKAGELFDLPILLRNFLISVELFQRGVLKRVKTIKKNYSLAMEHRMEVPLAGAESDIEEAPIIHNATSEELRKLAMDFIIGNSATHAELPFLHIVADPITHWRRNKKVLMEEFQAAGSTTKEQEASPEPSPAFLRANSSQEEGTNTFLSSLHKAFNDLMKLATRKVDEVKAEMDSLETEMIRFEQSIWRSWFSFSQRSKFKLRLENLAKRLAAAELVVEAGFRQLWKLISRLNHLDRDRAEGSSFLARCKVIHASSPEMLRCGQQTDEINARIRKHYYLLNRNRVGCMPVHF